MAKIIDFRTRKILWADVVTKIVDFVRANPPRIKK